MKTSELSNALRELAALVDASDLPPDHGVTISLATHAIKTRSELARWAAFIGKPVEVIVTGGGSWLQRYSGGQFAATAHFTPGLLGGKATTIVSDDQAGLDALLAEVPAESVGVA